MKVLLVIYLISVVCAYLSLSRYLKMFHKAMQLPIKLKLSMKNHLLCLIPILNILSCISFISGCDEEKIKSMMNNEMKDKINEIKNKIK